MNTPANNRNNNSTNDVSSIYTSTSSPPTNFDSIRNLRYLQELMQELQMMTEIYESNNSAKFRNAHSLLLREIQRVWSNELVKDAATSDVRTEKSDIQVLARITDFQKSVEIKTTSLKTSEDSNTNVRDTQESPEVKQRDNGDCKSPQTVERKTKLFFPAETETNSNLVGRLIGPRGMTIRQLEKDYECSLYIRGKGCMRDDEKEEHLRGKEGWSHLDEKMHVLIVAKGGSKKAADEKIEAARTRIHELLTNPNDALKRGQLVQLAVIEGTLRD